MRSVSHFTWQVLRAAKRSKKPPTGRALRVAPSRNTKDGAFLTALAEEGCCCRVSGSEDAPFEATYALTEKGRHAAEYGEYEYEVKPRPPQPAPRPAERSAKRKDAR